MNRIDYLEVNLPWFGARGFDPQPFVPLQNDSINSKINEGMKKRYQFHFNIEEIINIIICFLEYFY